jgi:hypothetical protein
MMLEQSESVLVDLKKCSYQDKNRGEKVEMIYSNIRQMELCGGGVEPTKSP